MCLVDKALTKYSFLLAPSTVQTLMARLARKLDEEGKPGGLVVSYRFALPEDRKGSRTVPLQDSEDDVMIYRIVEESPQPPPRAS